MNKKQKKNRIQIFKTPSASNIQWKEIESLFESLGCEISEGSGSRIRVKLNGVRAVFHSPHPDLNTDKGAVNSVRKFLLNAGVKLGWNIRGEVTFDSDAHIFHGEVINTRDVITFQGKSVDELESAFQESIKDYITWCEEDGVNPEKPYSGKFNLRISPELHKEVAITARMMKISTNKFVEKAVQDEIYQLQN